jgi:hypothetical protein
MANVCVITEYIVTRYIITDEESARADGRLFACPREILHGRKAAHDDAVLRGQSGAVLYGSRL